MPATDGLNADEAARPLATTRWLPDILALILAHGDPGLPSCDLDVHAAPVEFRPCAPFLRPHREWAGMLLAASCVNRDWHEAVRPMLEALFVGKRLNQLPRDSGAIRHLALEVLSPGDGSVPPNLRTLAVERTGSFGSFQAPALRAVIVRRVHIDGLKAICAAAPALRRLRVGGVVDAAQYSTANDQFRSALLDMCGTWPALAHLVELDVGGPDEVVTLLLSACGGALERLMTRCLWMHAADEALVTYGGQLTGLRHLVLDETSVQDAFDTPFQRLPSTVSRIDIGFRTQHAVLGGESVLVTLRIIRDQIRAGRWRQLEMLKIALAPNILDAASPDQAACSGALDGIRAACCTESIECEIWTRPFEYVPAALCSR